MYSNDTSDNAKNEGRPVVDGEFKRHVLMLVHKEHEEI
jgi:hypothetical protein